MKLKILTLTKKLNEIKENEIINKNQNSIIKKI